jgi:hypothetical protein
MALRVEYRTLDRYPGYRFGSDGSVWSQWIGRGRTVRIGSEWNQLATKSECGNYPLVNLRVGDGREVVRVHRLIAEAFHGPCPEGQEVRHINDNTRANIAASNLCYGTRTENVHDRRNHGTEPRGETHFNAKLDKVQVQEIKRLRNGGMKRKDVAMLYGVSLANISSITTERTWKDA